MNDKLLRRLLFSEVETPHGKSCYLERVALDMWKQECSRLCHANSLVKTTEAKGETSPWIHKTRRALSITTSAVSRGRFGDGGKGTIQQTYATEDRPLSRVAMFVLSSNCVR